LQFSNALEMDNIGMLMEQWSLGFWFSLDLSMVIHSLAMDLYDLIQNK